MPKRVRDGEEVIVFKKTKKTDRQRKPVVSKYKNPKGKTMETKFIDTIAAIAVNYNGQVQLLNGCIQGSDFSNRIGRKIEMTSCSVDICVSGGTIAAANYATNFVDYVRVALVYDKQPNTAAVVYSDVYTTATANSAPMSTRNVNNLDRFDVLKVWEGMISNQGEYGFVVQDYVKFNLDTRFDASNAGTIADITSGALLLLLCDQNTTGVNNMTAIGQIRVRFHDN